MTAYLAIETFARERLDVSVEDVMHLLGCSRHGANRRLRFLREMGRLHRAGRGLYRFGDHEDNTAKHRRTA